MRKLALVIVLLSVLEHTTAQSKSNSEKQIDLAGLLEKFLDLSSLPEYETGTYSAQVSSYDTTGNNNDGFGGHYSFIRRNPDSTLVIFEQAGPGVINRIWTPTPTTDTLDFFIDNALKPSFSICYMDLYTGKVYPFVVPLCANQLGGYYCYLPIPFSQSCKIVLRAKKTRFHQIGYRLYPVGTNIKSFSLPLTAEEKESLSQIATVWNKPSVSLKDLQRNASSLSEVKKNFTLKPGQSITAFQSLIPGRIAGFEIISSSKLDNLAKNIDIRISWDDEKSPAVYSPLADFFGYSFGKSSMKGLLIGSDGKRHYSWFPMPYDKSAKIELVYRTQSGNSDLDQVNLLARFYFVNKKRDVQKEGKFYAYWNRENLVPTGKPFTMLDVKGKGHYAGTVLQSQGLVPGITIFFEGDDSTVIDGKMRLHGTGSEDFFNGGWYALLDCWDDAMSLPLSGSLEYSIPLSRTGGYRYFITDKLSFDQSFYHSIEHGPEHNRWPSDYTSVSYYYCDRLNKQNVYPTTGNTKIFMPDTLEIYPQLMLIAMDETLSAEAKWEGSPAKTVYYTVSGNSLLKMSLEKIPVGEYDVYFDYQKRNDAVQFSIWQRQTQISDWIDAYASQTDKLKMQKITSITLSELNNSMSFRFKTTEQRNKFVLTRIILVRK